MSIPITSAFGAVAGVATNLGAAASGIQALAGLISGATTGSWLASLLPASWNGIPFGVTSNSIKPGRSTADHGYPFRESPAVWVEDTGAGPRPFSLTGFLVENDVVTGAGSLYGQQQAMIQACLQPGPGVLVHPSLGTCTVSLIDGCEMVERLGLGGAIELRFQFLETAPGPEYPTASDSTADDVDDAADDADDAAGSDFADDVVGSLQTGAAVVGQAAATVGQWTEQATALVGDATRAAGAVTGFAGVVGRYAGGSRLNAQPVGATIGLLVGAATAARTAVGNAANVAQSLAEAL